MKVKLQHARQLKYCVSGVRMFLYRHNLSFREFATTGLDEKDLLATNDDLAKNVVRVAREEFRNGLK